MVHILKCGSTLLQERYMNVCRGGLASGFECYTTTSCFLSSLKPELSEKSKIIDFRSIIRNIQLIEVWGSSQKQYISLLYSNFLLYKSAVILTRARSDTLRDKMITFSNILYFARFLTTKERKLQETLPEHFQSVCGQKTLSTNCFFISERSLQQSSIQFHCLKCFAG